MGLLLICPHCRVRIPVASRHCSTCGADLRNLPAANRCYFFGLPEEVSATPPDPETVSGPLSVAITAEVVSELPETMVGGTISENKEVSLCEALDRILHKGAVLYGEVMISVADIDLVYLGLQVILASMETARGFTPALGAGRPPNLFDKRVS